MSNLNSPNEPIYPPCPKGWPTPCRCDYCASETERIDVAFYGAEAAARAEEARLRTFLKDCDCRCCEARARLAVLSCPAPDRRNSDPDEIRELVRACVVDCIAALYPRARPGFFRETIDAAAAKTVRPAPAVEVDTGA